MQRADRAHDDNPVLVVGLSRLPLQELPQIGPRDPVQRLVRPLKRPVRARLRSADSDESVCRGRNGAIRGISRHRRVNVCSRLVAAVQERDYIRAVRCFHGSELAHLKAVTGINPVDAFMPFDVHHAIHAELSSILLEAWLDNTVQGVGDLFRGGQRRTEEM